LNKTYRK